MYACTVSLVCRAGRMMGNMASGGNSGSEGMMYVFSGVGL